MLDTQSNINQTGFENAVSFTAHHAAYFSQNFQPNTQPPLWLDWIDTPMGSMLAICDNTHIFMLEFTTRKAMLRQFQTLYKTRKRPIKIGRTAVTEQIETELSEYFKGRLNQFKTAIMPTGTDFQAATWQQLRQIPHGQTRSYAQLAQMVGNPKAVRAVANANSRNGLAIIIPCHRVIGSDGGLGGYAGGVRKKVDLLAIERA